MSPAKSSSPDSDLSKKFRLDHKRSGEDVRVKEMSTDDEGN